ncbi:MAG: ATP-binding cassette domain-containing protein [Pseudomonadota bacterium]
MSVYQRAKEIINLNRDTIWVVFVYAAAIALLSLIIPIAAQSLVNVVSFGTLLQPVVVLTVIVFAVLTVVAGMRIAQAIVVETIQQRMFAQIGIKLAKILPESQVKNFDEYRVSELVNRFFEVQTIQKALAILLVTGIEISLLAVFSMVLIAFYHPLLLAFDIVLVISLFIALWLPWKKALHFAIEECAAKHEFAAWLEEIVHNIFLFKMQNHQNYSLSVADERISTYLVARKKHFKNILKHLFGINIIYVVANAALLGIGGYLVIKEQLSLGQFVASELIINALLYGFVRFSFYLEDLYDLLAACFKLGNLMSLPLEKPGTIAKTHLTAIEAKLSLPPKIEAKKISYLTNKNTVLFQGLNFAVNAGKTLVVQGNKGTGKSLLVDILLGFRLVKTGSIQINGIPVQEYNLVDIRKYAALVRHIELFSGSIFDNLVMHRADIAIETIHKYLNEFQLTKTIEVLPDGLDTFISGSQMTMSTIELKKLMFIRAVLTQPSFLVIDATLDDLPAVDLDIFLPYLKQYPGTKIITTRRQDIASFFESVLQL